MGYTKVSRDLYIRKALGNLWVLGKKFLVTLLGGLAEIVYHTALEGDMGFESHYPEKMFHYRNILKGILLILMRNKQDFAVFQRLNVELGRNLVHKTIKIRHPPVFRTEEKHLLISISVNVINAKQSFGDKGFKSADFSLLKKKFFLFNFLFGKKRTQLSYLFFFIFNVFRKITLQQRNIQGNTILLIQK